VLAAVQTLRQRAEASGNLKSTERVKVSRAQAPATGGTGTAPAAQVITIESTTPDYMYVPVYDPRVAYGDWPYSDYEPFYWYPGDYIGTGPLRWLAGIAIGAAIWGNVDWWRNRVDIDIDRYNRFNRTNIVNRDWNHNPRHRGNVPYRDAHVAQRFGDANRAASRDAFRGKADAGRRDLATKAGAAAAGAAAGAAAAKGKAAAAAKGKAAAGAKGKAAAAGKSRPSATTKHAGKGKSAAKTKTAAQTNRAKSAKSASQAARSKQASRSRAASHRPQARAHSPARQVQRHAYRPSMGGRGGGGGFRASGFRGGGGGFRGGGGRGGGRRSDVALKHDIVLLGHLDNGLGFYRFAYNGSNQAYVGVMAQEVQKVRPEAVVRGPDGYLRVHYDQLGLKFQTYRQWTASGARIPGQ
jgi:hypothetical protein